MSVRFINKNNKKQSINLKFNNNCTINDVKPKKNNSIYEEMPYSVDCNKNKSIVLSDTQYSIITALAKGMYYDFCDAWDNDKVLTEDDLAMAYERFKNGENIFGIKIKKFEYFKNEGIVNITTENGEFLNIDFETELEKKYSSNKYVAHDYWEKNHIEDFDLWKKNKSAHDFLHALGNRESGNNYFIQNRIGYLGRFQLGEAALYDVGFYSKDDSVKNDWKGEWTAIADKYKVSSKKTFLSTPNAQNYAIFNYIKKQWNYIKYYKLDAAINKVINGNKITISGLLAAAHLVGVGSVKKYIESNGKKIPRDGNGVSLEEYLTKFGGFDLNIIIND